MFEMAILVTTIQKGEVQIGALKGDSQAAGPFFCGHRIPAPGEGQRVLVSVFLAASRVLGYSGFAEARGAPAPIWLRMEDMP